MIQYAMASETRVLKYFNPSSLMMWPSWWTWILSSSITSSPSTTCIQGSVRTTKERTWEWGGITENGIYTTRLLHGLQLQEVSIKEQAVGAFFKSLLENIGRSGVCVFWEEFIKVSCREGFTVEGRKGRVICTQRGERVEQVHTHSAIWCLVKSSDSVHCRLYCAVLKSSLPR